MLFYTIINACASKNENISTVVYIFATCQNTYWLLQSIFEFLTKYLHPKRMQYDTAPVNFSNFKHNFLKRIFPQKKYFEKNLRGISSPPACFPVSKQGPSVTCPFRTFQTTLFQFFLFSFLTFDESSKQNCFMCILFTFYNLQIFFCYYCIGSKLKPKFSMHSCVKIVQVL